MGSMRTWRWAFDASTSIYTFTSQDIQGFQRVPISGMEAPIHLVNAAFGDTFPSQISEAA